MRLDLLMAVWQPPKAPELVRTEWRWFPEDPHAVHVTVWDDQRRRSLPVPWTFSLDLLTGALAHPCGPEYGEGDVRVGVGETALQLILVGPDGGIRLRTAAVARLAAFVADIREALTPEQAQETMAAALDGFLTALTERGATP